MPRPPKKPNKLPDLPVLTEISDADIPVLTEVLEEELPLLTAPSTAPLTDTQCQQLAAQIAPHLESLLRDKFAAHLAALWPEIWRDVQVELPKLVRAQLAETARRSRK